MTLVLRDEPSVLRDITNKPRATGFYLILKYCKHLYNENLFLKASRTISPGTQELLKPSVAKTKKRGYKKRLINYILSTEEHREAKRSALEKKKPKKKTKIRANVDVTIIEEGMICRICSISAEEDENNPNRRSVSWVYCLKCKQSLHVKCLPRGLKQSYPYLGSKIISGQKFDFICC